MFSSYIVSQAVGEIMRLSSFQQTEPEVYQDIRLDNSTAKMTEVFLTGASGYIGGQVLLDLVKAYPDIHITCLLRDEAKAQILRQAFGSISTVIGDLDATEILEENAAKSDVVVHLAATGHIGSTKALVNGLMKKPGNMKGHFIQIGGASGLSQAEIASKTCGKASETRYHDLTGLEEIRKLIKLSPNRVVDNYMLFDCPASVKSAIVIGPLFYGEGKGLFNKRSMQAPTIAELTIKRGAGINIGDGENRWSNIHIADLSDLMVRLIGSSLGRDFKEATWNEEGVYFAENGEMTFKELCTATAMCAFQQGRIQSPTIKHVLSAEETDQVMHRGLALLGTNARTDAQRARQLLGWSPTGPSLSQTLDGLVQSEAMRLEAVSGQDK